MIKNYAFAFSLAALVAGGASGQMNRETGVVNTDSKLHTIQSAGEFSKKQNNQISVQRGGGTVVFSEDFANGMAGNNGIGAWTTSGANGNIWRKDMNGPDGQYTDQTEIITSATVSNGFMALETDSANCDWSSGSPVLNFSSLIDWVSQLVSPTIDMTAYPNALIKFRSAHRHCCSNDFLLTLDVSTDGFATFTSFAINEAGDANSGIDETYIFDISSAIAGNLSNVQFRFNWDAPSYVDGNGSTSNVYYWMIDDVEVIEAFDFDLIIEEPSFSILGIEYFAIPTQQVSESFFTSYVSNRGGKEQTNVVLNTTITGPAAYSSTSPGIDTLITGAMDSLYDTLTAWTIPAITGDYTLLFEVASDSTQDFNEDDTLSKVVSVTDYVYARDNGTITGVFTDWASNVGSATIGNLFDIFADDTITGVNVGISSGTDFTTAPVLVIYIEKFDNNSGSWVLLDESYHELSAATHGTGGVFAFPITAHQPVLAGETVLVHAGSLDAQNSPIRIYMAQKSTQGTVIGSNQGSNDNKVSLIDPEAPIVRLNFDPANRLASTSEITEQSSLFENYPNPFVGETVIGYSLNNSASVVIEITDVTGKKVAVINEGTKPAGNHKVSFNGANLSAGVYNYSLIVNNSRITKQMTVSK